MNRYFYPDSSATSQLLTELATVLAGPHDIMIVTSRQLSNDASADLAATEMLEGVRVIRLWTTRFGRSRIWRRAVDYLSFYCAVLLYLLWNVTRNDIVVLKTDPPLLPLVNTSVIRFKGGKVINWLQDLYPEIAVRLEKFPGPVWLSNVVGKWRDKALRAAYTNVVVSKAMANYLNSRGVSNTQIIANWADEVEITPIAHEYNPLRSEWGLQGKFVVMYSGNFGRAHSFSEIAQAVYQLAGEADIQFVFVGEGAGLDVFRKRLEDAKSGNFVFKPFQPKEQLRFSLGAADLHLVSLKPGMEDLLMPSKVYGILAAARAVAFVGDADGEIAASIRELQIGFAVAHGDGGALSEGLLRLRQEPALLAACQQNARALFESEYARSLAVASWLRLFDQPHLKSTGTMSSET